MPLIIIQPPVLLLLKKAKYMELLSPTALKALCEKYYLTPSKQYGQNYLITKKPIEKMIEVADLQKTDTVIEIGPGFGILTTALAPQVKQVIAFEIEQKIREYWDTLQNTHKNIEVVWGNVLTTWHKKEKEVKKGYKLIANVPYQITSELIEHFLETSNKPERIIIMLQKEVAERICQKPGKMSLLSVAVQYYGKASVVLKVPSGSFFPQPKVDSAVLMIADIQDRPNSKTFFKVVKAGFSSKRKQLLKNLTASLHYEKEQVKKILENVCGSHTIRAQELSIQMWEDIVKELKNKSVNK